MTQQRILLVKHRVDGWEWIWLLAMPALVVTFLFLFATGLADRKAGWTETLVAFTVIGVGYPAFGWFLLRHVMSQYVAIQPDGLVIRGIFSRRTVPFAKIADVRKPDWSITEWSNEGNLGTFLKRKFEPVWERQPNVEVTFRQPVRLNSFPFPWYKLLSLTLEQPEPFIRDLSDKLKGARA
jgi:hypothetical protein